MQNSRTVFTACYDSGPGNMSSVSAVEAEMLPMTNGELSSQFQQPQRICDDDEGCAGVCQNCQPETGVT